MAVRDTDTYFIQTATDFPYTQLLHLTFCRDGNADHAEQLPTSMHIYGKTNINKVLWK